MPITRPRCVEEWPARVAVVDRRVRLDRVRDRDAVRRVDGASCRADDPRGHGAVEAERVADRVDRVADLRRGGAAGHERMQRRRWGVDPDDRDIGRRVRRRRSRRGTRRRWRSRRGCPLPPWITWSLVAMSPWLVDYEPGAERSLLLAAPARTTGSTTPPGLRRRDDDHGGRRRSGRAAPRRACVAHAGWRWSCPSGRRRRRVLVGAAAAESTGGVAVERRDRDGSGEAADDRGGQDDGERRLHGSPRHGATRAILRPPASREHPSRARPLRR